MKQQRISSITAWLPKPAADALQTMLENEFAFSAVGTFSIDPTPKLSGVNGGYFIAKVENGRTVEMQTPRHAIDEGKEKHPWLDKWHLERVYVEASFRYGSVVLAHRILEMIAQAMAKSQVGRTQADIAFGSVRVKNPIHLPVDVQKFLWESYNAAIEASAKITSCSEVGK